MAEVISLPLSSLRLDRGTQVRLALEPSAVRRYRKLYRSGHEVDPVKAVYDGAVYVLYDGFHRVRAAYLAKQEYVKVEVTRGDAKLARWLASGANARHGVPMDREARRNAIRMAVASRPEDIKGFRSIARQVGVSNHTVRFVLVSDYLKDNPQASDADVVAHFSRQGFWDDVSTAMTESSVAAVRDRMEKAQKIAQREGQLPLPRQEKPAPTPVSIPSQGGAIAPPPVSSSMPEGAPEPTPEEDAERIPLPPVPQKVTRPKPPPSPVGVSVDCVGREIPDHLRGVFNDPALREACDAVALWAESIDPEHVLRVMMQRRKALPYLSDDALRANLKEAENCLTEAAQILSDAMPYAVCPDCGGNGCESCAFAGCVPASRYREMQGGQR